jgi:hypothetical protein
MAVASEWAKLGASVQTTCKSVNANHAAHQAVAGAVQAAISRLPPHLRAFGDFMYSPLDQPMQREMAEAGVFRIAVEACQRMTQKKFDRAEFVAKGVLFRYRMMNQGGQGGCSDPLEKPEAFREWLYQVYGVKLDSRNWEREWQPFCEACFGACNDFDRRALGPVSTVIAELSEVA